MAERKVAPAVYLDLAAAPAVSSAAAPRSAPRCRSNAFAQVTFAYRPVGTHGLDHARHRRQRAVPGLPRRHRAGQGHPGRVPRGRQGQQRQRLRAPRRTASSATPHPAAAAAPVRSVRSPSPTTSASRARTTPRWAAPATGSRTARRRSSRWTPKDQIWKGTYTTDPGRVDYDYKAAINKSWDENYGAGGAKGGGNITYTAPGGNRDVLLRPRARTTSRATPRARSSRRRARSRASSAAPPTGAPPACARGCRTPTVTAPTPGPPTRSPPAATSSRSRTACRGTRTTAPTNGNNVAFRCPPTATVVDHLLRPVDPRRSRVKTSRAGSAPDLKKAKAIWVVPRPRRVAGLVGARGHRPATWPRGACTGRPTGGLAVDAEAVTGGSTRDACGTTPQGCPPPSSPPTPSSRATWPCGSSRATARDAGGDPARARWPWRCTTTSGG